MKAVVLRRPGDASALSLETVPDPTPSAREGVLRVAAPVIGRSHSLEEASAAHEAVESAAVMGRVVLSNEEPPCRNH